MKKNIFGYIFFIFIIGIIIFAIYKVNYGNGESANNTTSGNNSSTNVEKGTEITLAISEFDTINPIITKNKKVQDITKIMYEPLVNITSDGKAEGCLAEEWETTDNMTYIVKLKENIKWSDGSEFSSDDVKYTIDRLKETEDSVYAENVRYVKEVDIIDSSTLRIILSEVVPFYEYYLNFPILSYDYYGDDDFWNTEKNDAPTTTGMFKISEVTGNTIILEKNEQWWNIQENESTIEKITINLYSSVAELYNAFKLGNIDIISTTNKDYQNYIGTIGYNVTEIEGRNFVFLALNTQSSILSDSNVRKAIRASINKDNIVSNIYENTYLSANFPLNTTSYLIEESEENYYNVEETGNLLRASDWNLRNGVWRKTINGRTTNLELNLVVNSSDENRVAIANYLKEQLAEQGIVINIIQANNSNYNDYLENKNYDLILCEATSSISPDLTTYFGNNNLANFSNSEVSEIMQYIDNITNEDELKSNYQKLYEIYNNEVPYIGIARNKIYVISSTYLVGEINSRWYNLFFNIKDWYTN